MAGFLGMRQDESTHLKPLKNGGHLLQTIPCQADTEGVTTMTINSIDELMKDPKHLVAVTAWIVLGDGNINIPAKGNNGFIQVFHKESSEDLIRMKQLILSKITGVTVTKYFHSKYGTYNWQLRTSCHPLFTKLKQKLYLDGRKTLSEQVIKSLSPLCLAILYQDDGRYNASKSTISINKPLFSELELEMLAKHIVDTFGIIFRVRRSCKLKDGSIGHEMGLRISDKDRFFDLIRPYVVSSMLYKVSTGGSVNNH
jgi:hypothetical protein